MGSGISSVALRFTSAAPSRLNVNLTGPASSRHACLPKIHYIPEKKQAGKRHWVGKKDEQRLVYANRQRLQRPKGKRLLRKRGELIERTFAHCYDTGGMRRTHLRKHNNILKRLLIHVAGANLGLLLRSLYGMGTPRGLQGLSTALDSFILLVAYALESENPQSIGAGVTSRHSVPPYYHPAGLFSYQTLRNPKTHFNPGLLGRDQTTVRSKSPVTDAPALSSTLIFSVVLVEGAGAGSGGLPLSTPP
jgi:hypothetical protein